MMSTTHRNSIGFGTINDTIADRPKRQDEDGAGGVGGAGGGADDLFQNGELLLHYVTIIIIIFPCATIIGHWRRRAAQSMRICVDSTA